MSGHAARWDLISGRPVGVDEVANQIITLLICVHQIFEINGSRLARRATIAGRWITSFDRSVVARRTG